MGDSRDFDDETHRVSNDISGEVNGPVGQFGTVHGDVNMSWNQPASTADTEFQAQYQARMRAQWERERKERLRESRSKRYGSGCFGVVLIVMACALFFGESNLGGSDWAGAVLLVLGLIGVSALFRRDRG
ncbi:hypothetical protein ACIBKX_14915 [Streptomyces sp. NPDC050658]|uniref:hypothetical protein n=1 Tax=unclassified Streptomyces TaxID=2593676 RepID=UPI00343F3E4F